MFLIRLVFLPVRIALGSVGLGFRVGRLFGYRRLFVFGAGVVTGVLVAPVAGAEMRRRIQQAIEEGGVPGGGDGDVAERVRTELSRSPRTWHLPQPSVEATAGRVVLRGEVPHDLGRADLERTAASVPGVAAVDNLLVVTGTNGDTNGAGTSTTA